MVEDIKLSNRSNAPSEAAAKVALKPPGPTPATDPRWGQENCCVREFWAVIERDG